MTFAKQESKMKVVNGILSFGVVGLLAAPLAWSQNQLTGVSHPDATVITTEDSSDTNAAPLKIGSKAKPSADIPIGPGETVYGPYVPYRAPGAPAAATQPAEAFDPDATIVTERTAGLEQRRLLAGPGAAAIKADPDAGIVTFVPTRAGEIADGTLIKAKLRESLSTLKTQPGTKFTAEVSEPLMSGGKVIVPVGSVLEGRVTWVRGGKRIGGPAALHLEPRTIILPDGGQYMLQARVIDTDHWDDTRVDEEGTILRHENGKKTLAALSLAAGGPMAAGAIIGGVPGAVIGAGVGVGVGTVIWLKQDRQAELPKDLVLVFSLTEPMIVTPMTAAVPITTIKAAGGE